jgi:hypothetical protein
LIFLVSFHLLDESVSLFVVPLLHPCVPRRIKARLVLDVVPKLAGFAGHEFPVFIKVFHHPMIPGFVEV